MAPARYRPRKAIKLDDSGLGLTDDPIQRNVLTDAVIDDVLSEIRREIAAQLPEQEVNIATLKPSLKRRLFVAKAERVDTFQLELELGHKLAALDELALRLSEGGDGKAAPPDRSRNRRKPSRSSGPSER